MKYFGAGCIVVTILIAVFVIFSAFNDGDGIRAVCEDGTISKSKHNRGTCSGHGGVKIWAIKR